MHEQRLELLTNFMLSDGHKGSVLEVGCGGSPQTLLRSLASSYTGADFSKTGIDLARRLWRESEIPVEFRVEDSCNLSFETAAFDAVYSAHMIYHIDSVEAQKLALEELVRVLKPGGKLILITANPRPLLFPVRLLIRLIAESPVLGKIARRIKGNSPLPYNPQKISTTMGWLCGCQEVRIQSFGMASTSFNQNVSEYSFFGRYLWRGIRFLQLNYPEMSAYLGNYVVFCCRK